MKTMLLWVIILMSSFGCGSSLRLQYTVDPPLPDESIIRGLNAKDKIIEIFDAYNGRPVRDGRLWMVVQRGKAFALGELDLGSGKVKLVKRLRVYDHDSTLYWTAFREKRIGVGKRLLGSLAGALGGEGTTDAYNASARKVFWGIRGNYAVITYGFERTHQTNLLAATATNGDLEVTNTNANLLGQTFISGGDSFNIVNTEGFRMVVQWDSQKGKSNMKRSRYYPTQKMGYFMSFHPDLYKKKVVYFCAHELKTETVWAAGLVFPEEFIDAGITKDGAWLGVVTGKPGQYILRRYAALDFIDGVQNFKIRQ